MINNCDINIPYYGLVWIVKHKFFFKKYIRVNDQVILVLFVWVISCECLLYQFILMMYFFKFVLFFTFAVANQTTDGWLPLFYSVFIIYLFIYRVRLKIFVIKAVVLFSFAINIIFFLFFPSSQKLWFWLCMEFQVLTT